MRLTFVIASLAGGGAERVANYMAGYWAEKGWRITIVTIAHGHRPIAYPLSTGVAHHDLDFYGRRRRPSPNKKSEAVIEEVINECSDAEKEILRSEFNLIVALREAIQSTDPELVISFMDVNNIRTLVATHRLGVPVIVSEHSDPYLNGFTEAREQLRRRLYPGARYVVALTEDVIRFLSPVAGSRGRVIPNAVMPSLSISQVRKKESKPGRTLMSMGRLSHEKGFALLLEAFAMIAGAHPDWSLEIWGEGPLRDALERSSRELGLAGRVHFPGFTPDPGGVMRGADLFVVSSLCEGWSNVLAEAMSNALPVVSFDCPSGPRNIIRDGIDGVLVPPQNVSAMASALDAMMKDEGRRKRLASRAPEIRERFSLEKIMAMWDEIVLDAAPRGDS